VIQKVLEIDRRYRSSWDVRAIAQVTGVGRTTVAQVLKEARGPRPQAPKERHDRRTRFIRTDVMWASDFMELPGKRQLLKTLDEMSRFRLGWTIHGRPTAQAAVDHAEDIIERMGRAPLVWKYDHGSPFTSDYFQEFLEEYKILPFPIPPRAPWANGRVERDHQEIQNWLIPVWDKNLVETELERDVDEGMRMLNFIKPRWVLGYKTSANAYFHTDSAADLDRDWLALDLEQIKCTLYPQRWLTGERLQRKAVRLLLEKWGLYEEWEEIPEDARTDDSVNRSSDDDVAF
jgi:transposase InsO family protein